MNADEIVRALKLCAVTDDCYEDKTDCPYKAVESCEDELKNKSADLIESLQAQLAEANKRIETKETLLRLQATTMSMLSSDKDTLIHKLRGAEAQLSASQRREKAAVEDIAGFITEHEAEIKYVFEAKDSNFLEHIIRQWRGPQAGEGDAG